MKTKFFVLFFSSLALLFSCSSKEEEQVSENQESVSEVPSFVNSSPVFEESISFRAGTPVPVPDEEIVEDASLKDEIEGKNSTVLKKKIIKDGNISVKTNDINASKKGFDEILKKLNAYYESEELQNNEMDISYILKIRVPADNFEKLITFIENGQDEIKSKTIQTRDVTEEFIDIETRLTTKRDYLKRYKELLSKASSVKDILEIEENIKELQEEIESSEGRLKYLNDQVLYSTLIVELIKKKEFVYKPQPQDNFFERVKTSLANGWTSIVDFVLWLIKIWPYIIVILVVLFVIRRVYKKRKRKQP